MFRHRLPTDRFFAHIRALDLECPRCGYVYTFSQTYNRHGISAAWDSQTNRFRCHACYLAMGLGVLGWPLAPGGKLLRAEDAVPTVHQARELKVLQAAMRRQAQGYELDPTDLTIPRITGRAPRNIVLTDECSCDPAAPYAHPSCPVHGHGGA